MLTRYAFGFQMLLMSMVSLCIGTAFAKGLFPTLGATGTSAYRLGFAALLLWVVWRPWRFDFSPRCLPPLLFYGVSLGLLNLLFYLSLQTIPLGIAIAIEFCGPLSLALMSSRQRSDFIWIGMVVIGLFFLLPLKNEAPLDPLGLLYAAGAGICWAAYIVAGQRLHFMHPGQATAYGISLGAVVVLPFALLSPGVTLFQPKLFGMGLLVGLLSSALPYSLEMLALRHLDRKSIGVLLSLEPAIGATAAAVMLGEMLTLQQLMAIACIVMASIGCALNAQRPKNNAEIT